MEELRKHGSRDRVPGALFRELSKLYLEARPEITREALIRKLSERLRAEGVEYHVRTLRRQVIGKVASVPPEVERALRGLALEDIGFADEDAIVGALERRGAKFAPEARRSPHVPIDRLATLARLWLHLNPSESKRRLALRLSRDLSARGVQLSVDALQAQLAGRGHLARREVFDELCTYLAPHGLDDPERALRRADELAAEIGGSIHGQELVDPARFRQLCRVWQIQHKQASTRPLADALAGALERRGIHVGTHHLQRAISGKTPRVRREMLRAMEDLARTDGVEEQVNAGLELRTIDLSWVRCGPIAQLATTWLSSNAGVSMRQLALRVSDTVRRMGYPSNHNTIQPILGGWKKKTRGYVYRAMLRQFTDRPSDTVPLEDVIDPSPELIALAKPEMPPEPKRSDERLTWDAFLRDAQRHLHKARSPHFVKLAALRAEQLFGVPKSEAEAHIRGEARGRPQLRTSVEGGLELAHFGEDDDGPRSLSFDEL